VACPTSIRTVWRYSVAKSANRRKEYKAWSQNLGHENVLTTFASYGDVGRHRQAGIIRAFGATESSRHQRRNRQSIGQCDLVYSVAGFRLLLQSVFPFASTFSCI
jgi:hypothetical protein